ncbi:MAG: MogA/MoaB family molybdenum cofactor biosynthesis protein [Nitrospirota bacterium]|jgi:molybdenum cofactor synthesis domain-containing protein
MITACVLTMSDRASAGKREDESGPVIREMLEGAGIGVKNWEILPDSKELIMQKLVNHAGAVDLIITTGGTGLSPRDVTPDATLEVVDREVPGIAEAMRAASLVKTPRAMLSRAAAGVKGKALIINLPGSPRGARENLEAVLGVIPHAVEKIKGSEEECAR